MLAREHIIPRLGTLQLQKLTPGAINALYAHLSEHGRVHGGGPLSASSVRRVHAVLHRACHDAVRWGRLTRQPGGGRRSAQGKRRAPRQAAGVDARSSSAPSSAHVPTIASTPSGECWP